jgi:hypothetical protein
MKHAQRLVLLEGDGRRGAATEGGKDTRPLVQSHRLEAGTVEVEFQAIDAFTNPAGRSAATTRALPRRRAVSDGKRVASATATALIRSTER